jgi:acyl-CoA synthetase (NDP forming)
VRRSRGTDWRGPLLIGPNCLGIRSLPGRYDTLFIPRHKLRFPEGQPTPVALISQSGAFAVARASNLPWLNPRYVVTFGNQIDVTLSDYLHFLKNDPELQVYACYLEGFMPGDGLAWLEAAAEITASGRPVILYRAGRTSAGAQAAASHTASVAGDYAVTRELAQSAGVLVADTPEDFDDLLRLACLLRNKEIRGRRVGALSNAGFECVAIADHAGGFSVPPFTEETRAALAGVLAKRKLDSIGNVRNPMDVTPILDDALYEEMVRMVMDDPNVDVGVIGCVPLTGALNTLAASSEHREDISREGSLALRLAKLHEESTKAWVGVVDSGPLYDPMACFMEEHSIPTFRTADRALEMLAIYCRWRISLG